MIRTAAAQPQGCAAAIELAGETPSFFKELGVCAFLVYLVYNAQMQSAAPDRLGRTTTERL